MTNSSSLPIFRKIFLIYTILHSFHALAACGCKQKPALKPLFSVDFSKSTYRYTRACVIHHDQHTQFTSGHWDLSKEGSFIEIELSIDKDPTHEYALELLARAHKESRLCKVSIFVNDYTIANSYQMYHGPTTIHFLDAANKPTDFRWEVFSVTDVLKKGKNKIRISLDEDTQSGISLSWLHLRSTAK